MTEIVGESVGTSQRTILCPHCRESEPTCVINLDKATYYCRACKSRGLVSDMPQSALPDGVKWELEDRRLL